MYYHAGAITGCSTSPVSHLVATAGVDKTVRVYDYVNNAAVCETILNAEGTSIIWAPKLVSRVHFSHFLIVRLKFQNCEYFFKNLFYQK